MKICVMYFVYVYVYGGNMSDNVYVCVAIAPYINTNGKVAWGRHGDNNGNNYY